MAPNDFFNGLLAPMVDPQVETPARDFADLVLDAQLDSTLLPEREEFRHENRGLGAWSQYIAMRVAQRALWYSPHFVQKGAIAALARLCRIVDRRHTRGARDYIATAMPHLSAREVDGLVLDAWKHLMRLGVSSEGLAARLTGRRLGDHFDVELSDAARAVLESDGGCMLVTAHVGDWEIAALALKTIGFAPIFGVGKVPRNDLLAQRIQRMRESLGGLLIGRKGAMRTVPHVVREGGSVILLLDHRARVKPVLAPFFGREAKCDRSAGVLVRRVKAPLVFFACYRAEERWRFRLDIGTVIRPDELAGLSSEGVAARINAEFERVILKQPDQYFWLHDRFKGMPARGA
ncbi:MAG: lysophospholipid acyltransferase family protein [bacterium]|nr:lysophospholipid acyltransferase family protein [bacterium]